MKPIRLILLGLLIIQTILCTGQNLQSGSIVGLVKDTSGEGVAFTSVSLLQNNSQVKSLICDIDGYFSMANIIPGTYDLKVTNVGYSPSQIVGIIIKEGFNDTLVIILGQSSVKLSEVLIFDYSVPVRSISSSVAGVNTRSVVTSEGISPVPKTNEVFIDGIRVRSTGAYDSYEEQYDDIEENEFQSALREPLSTFSIDVDKASYSNVRRFIEDGQLPPANAIRTEEMINYFSYTHPAPEVGEPIAIHTKAGRCPWNEKNILLSIGLKAKDIPSDDIPPSNFVFLLDVSGSMQAPNKLPLVKKSIAILVDQLSEKDRVAVVVYAGSAGVVLSPVKGSEKRKILNAIDRLTADGSTAGGEGIQLAYRLASENYDPQMNNRVILCTDGDFNVGVQSDGDLIRLIEEERNKGIFLSILGYGMGNYKDGKMEKLADKGNGNYFYIDDLMEAEKVLVREMKGSLYTIAKDVKLQVEFNPELVSEYRLVGYENRLMNAKDFDDDRKDAGELGAGQEVTAFYELVPEKNAAKVMEEMRYHSISLAATSIPDELGIIKFRYKEPLDSTSKLFSHIIPSATIDTIVNSDDFTFAAAVIQLSMLLRKSEFTGNATFDSTIALAKQGKGDDEEGDRSEFIKLCKMAKNISNRLSSR